MPVVLITGGTGLIGKNLTTGLIAKGYEVIIMSRNPPKTSENPMIHYAEWNVEEQKMDSKSVGKADYIINLAGAGVMDKRWSNEYKKQIVESRTKSCELIVKALKENTSPVKAVISASAIGWYGSSTQVTSSEGHKETEPAANDFLGDTCRQWEDSLKPVTELNKRLVILRMGIVLSNDGGALAEFKKPLRFGIAAIFGGGKQIISWIHIDDVCRMFIYAIENERLSGVYNAVAPLPVSNKKLMMKLGESLRGIFFIPVHVPKFILKLILGERSIELLKSTKVSWEKIKGTGFTFLYPTIDTALKELSKKK